MPSDEARFEALLVEVTAGMPDDESAANIRLGLTKTWEKPALEALEMVMQRTYNLSQARQSRTSRQSQRRARGKTS